MYGKDYDGSKNRIAVKLTLFRCISGLVRTITCSCERLESTEDCNVTAFVLSDWTWNELDMSYDWVDDDRLEVSDGTAFMDCVDSWWETDRDGAWLISATSSPPSPQMFVWGNSVGVCTVAVVNCRSRIEPNRATRDCRIEESRL